MTMGVMDRALTALTALLVPAAGWGQVWVAVEQPADDCGT